MNKEYAKSIGKLTVLKKTVRDIKKQLKNILDPIETIQFLQNILDLCVQSGSSIEDARWIIAYATDLEEL